MGKEITIKDVKKALNAINSEESKLKCNLCKYKGNKKYSFLCKIHGVLQISEDQSREVKKMFF